MRKLILFLVALIILLIVPSYLWYKFSLKPLTKNENFISVVIPKNTSTETIINILSEKQLIKSRLAFKIYTKVHRTDKHLRAGQFSISSHWSVPEIIDHLTTGGYEGVWITLLEGWRREQYALEIAKQVNNFSITEFLNLTQDQEGYLFPETYLVPATATPQSIVNLLTKTFKDKTQDLFTKNKSGLTDQQVIIIASILERESARDSDHPIIAGILIKRLNNDWPLQADATLQYSKVDNQLKTNNYQLLTIQDWWPTPFASDKELDSPYNTYVNPGLPPTPISNPGLVTIQSVLNPQSTDYWFYLTDLQGQMHYAETLDQHNQNIAKYLK